ncbi:MAG TPA: enoyl-CoA hydratase [Bryobacteraceae bacterium]|nr:enoyl-CoA hydratase [Bryobacteraceae bacterium]
MDYRNLKLTPEGSTAVLTLNRPERRNALSSELMAEMLAALDEVEAKDCYRALIIAAAGKAFCAGHDLSEMAGLEEAEYRRLFALCSELMRRVHEISIPVIAEVQGIATAAGCQLVAACDLAIASEDATFATPGVRIGLFCSTPMVPLTRSIGRKRAMEMLMTGREIDAGTAASWGLVNRVVAKEELLLATRELAQRISEASAYTVATGKRAFYQQVDMNENNAYTCVKEVMTANALAPDAQEGISAFLAKRAPVWPGS